MSSNLSEGVQLSNIDIFMWVRCYRLYSLYSIDKKKRSL